MQKDRVERMNGTSPETTNIARRKAKVSDKWAAPAMAIHRPVTSSRSPSVA
jgi:hypothetical protein